MQGRAAAIALVAAVLAILTPLWLSTAVASDRANAPPFSLQRLAADGTAQAGETLSLNDYRGQVVLVNFWATWCAPCVHELPSMQSLRDKLSDQPFEILALNVGEDPEQIQSFLDNFATEINFPVLLRADFWVVDDFGVKIMPTSVVIDKQGRVVEFVRGPQQWDSARIEQRMLALVAE